jgi:hypothetical protein
MRAAAPAQEEGEPHPTGGEKTRLTDGGNGAQESEINGRLDVSKLQVGYNWKSSSDEMRFEGRRIPFERGGFAWNLQGGSNGSDEGKANPARCEWSRRKDRKGSNS